MKRDFTGTESPVLRFISNNGSFRLIVLAGDKPGVALADAHGLTGKIRSLFIQAVHASILQAADLKQTMRSILQLKWAEGGISIEADWRGNVRGYVQNADAVEDLLLGSEVSGGTIAVIRMIGSHPGYTGYGSIFGSNLASALQSHYSTSEQLDSFFSFADDFSVMMQRVPTLGGKDLPDNTAATKNVGDEAGLSLSALQALTPQLSSILQAEPSELASNYGLTSLSAGAARISCSCNREQLASFIKGVHIDELRSMYQDGPWPVVVSCHNCSSDYSFERDELKQFLDERSL